MATSDDDGTAESLAQVRAERRHIQRLRVGQRRDRSHKAQATARAELAVEHPHDTGAAPLLGAGDSREVPRGATGPAGARAWQPRCRRRTGGWD